MRADEYLSRIDRLDARIFDLLTEKQRLMEMATRLSPDMTGLPHVSSVSDRVGSAAVKLASVDEEINRTVDRLIDARAEVTALLEMLPDDEYRVLHQYYVQQRVVGAIAENWTPRGITERQVFRIKARALRRVQAILDAREA